ncbi:MAG TPA: class I tRNA ligase family protein, partial [Longimicrobium sp.]|nr:class I tRNA ligase family protein [Longimicrobium sp.]
MPHAGLTIVTATPPTPNGDLHVGHLAGPFVAADVHARYLRLRGRDARLVCGTDPHQSYVAFKAAQLGEAPRETAARFGAEIEATLAAARVELDHFGRPLEPASTHRDVVNAAFARLWREGRLVPAERPWLYCEGCGDWVFEAYVSGRCPHCGAGAGGGGCEACGRPNDCVDLGEPRCRAGHVPSVRMRRQLVVPVAPHLDALRAYLDGAEMSPRVRALSERVLEDGFPEVSVTHPAGWGLPAPVPGWEHERLLSWAEMAFGYMAIVEDLAKRDPSLAGRSLWQGEGTEVVQFLGYDTAFFHALLNPLLYLAHGTEPPRTLVSNEFYRLDGAKFSTSRMHAVWGRELLAEAPADAVRFYLAWTAPEREQTNFTRADFDDTVRRELVEGWQGWLRDLGARVAAEGGEAPRAEATTPEHHAFVAELERLRDEAAAGYAAATFSPQRAARALCEVARRGRRFG